MDVLVIILAVVDILVAIGIVVLVLFQDANDQGMGSLAGQNNDSFYKGNMGRTKDVLMRKLTIALGIAFVVLTIIIGILIG